VFAAGFRGFSRNEIPKRLDRIRAQGAGNGDKFDDVDTALAAFILRNKGLRPAQFLGKRLLANAGSMSHCDKSGHEPGVFRGFEGLLHAPPPARSTSMIILEVTAVGGKCKEFEEQNGSI
jgi:hypothetical protein